MVEHRKELDRDQAVKPRLTGVCLSLVLLLWGVKPIFSGASMRLPLLVASGILVLMAIFTPERLRPLARVMHQVALWVTRGVSWFALLLAFWLVMTPVALIMKLTGRDLLKLRFDDKAKSYWTESKQRPPSLEEFRRQF